MSKPRRIFALFAWCEVVHVPSPVQVVTYDKLCNMQRGTWTTNPAPEETYFSNDTLCGFYNKARI